MVLVAIVTIGEYRVSGQSQAINGQIEGVVVDAAGAAVPNATVTVRNIGTGTERTLTTDEGGHSVFHFCRLVRTELRLKPRISSVLSERA